MDNLGPRTLYADTDSIVFSTKPGEWQPDLGDYLGDLTDEVPNNETPHFVTGGPKNYAFQTTRPDENDKITHCKIRGITLNHKNSLQINYDVIKNMVMTDSKDVVTVTDPCTITRYRNTASILTVSQNKDYRIVFDKRVLREHYVSYPYGY